MLAHMQYQPTTRCHARVHVAPQQVVRLAHTEVLTYANNNVNNTYCRPNPSPVGLRHEPCAPHQQLGQPHSIADRFIGDFNDGGLRA